MLPLVVEGQGLSSTLALVVTAALSDGVHISKVALNLEYERIGMEEFLSKSGVVFFFDTRMCSRVFANIGL